MLQTSKTTEQSSSNAIFKPLRFSRAAELFLYSQAIIGYLMYGWQLALTAVLATFVPKLAERFVQDESILDNIIIGAFFVDILIATGGLTLLLSEQYDIPVIFGFLVSFLVYGYIKCRILLIPHPMDR